jgi:coproporphyrinogen III oxidase-like Fe-S oxidoreductase
MHYTGPIFRPPFEASSLLLQVTVGCSHNACTFCTMYQGIPFSVSPMEEIEEDLLEARRAYPSVRRIFLEGADPFALSAKQLTAIAEKINAVFPEVQTIAAYASVKNIIGKTDEELKALRALKINELNIGVESGSDAVIRHLNKGYTLEEARTQLMRLNQAGIDFSLNIIIGAGGMDASMEHAAASAALVNAVKPYLIFVATLHVDDGSPLQAELTAGTFVENTLGQNLVEELAFLKRLELDDTRFFGLHTSNVVPIMGNLPKDKDRLIGHLEKRMAEIPQRILDSRPEKGYEGAAIID